MKKIPLYLQHFQMDCGAACVKMISLYYGKDAPIEWIQERCKVGTEGVSCKGICDALEDMDFKVIAGKVTLPNLRTKALLPCILHWDQSHFVVLYKVSCSGKRFIYHIADPSTGYVDYEENEFVDFWLSTNSQGSDKGSVILVEPVAEFLDSSFKPAGRKNKRNLNFLTSYFRRYRKFFLISS